MGKDSDDLTPEQRGATPGPRTLRQRLRRAGSRYGRLGRPQSWLTILVALAALAAVLALYKTLG